MSTTTESQLIDLLGRAGSAHGVYEEGELGGVYDQNWPQWYASYMLNHGLGTLLERELTENAVARWLADCDASYGRERPSVGWPAYYAARVDKLLES